MPTSTSTQTRARPQALTLQRCLVLAVCATGCSFDSDASSPAASVGVGASTGVDAPTGAAMGSDSATDTTNATATSSGPATTNEVPGAARVELDLLELNFEDTQLGQSTRVEVALNNVGGQLAVGLAASVPAPFAFPGGYPGDTGTCGSNLPAGDTCTITVEFASAQPGPRTGEFLFEYSSEDDPTLQQTAATMTAAALGRTANLLTNPDADNGLSGWAVPGGLPIWQTGTPGFDSPTAFHAGALDVVTNTSLTQSVDLSAFADVLLTGAVSYEFVAQARTDSDTEAYSTRLEFAGNGLLLTPETTGSQWAMIGSSNIAPPSANVQVTLTCTRTTFGLASCDAYFDALSLTLHYE